MQQIVLLLQLAIALLAAVSDPSVSDAIRSQALTIAYQAVATAQDALASPLVMEVIPGVTAPPVVTVFPPDSEVSPTEKKAVKEATMQRYRDSIAEVTPYQIENCDRQWFADQGYTYSSRRQTVIDTYKHDPGTPEGLEWTRYELPSTYTRFTQYNNCILPWAFDFKTPEQMTTIKQLQLLEAEQ